MQGPEVEIYCRSVTAPIWDTPIDSFDFGNKKLVVFLFSVSELSPNLESCLNLLDDIERKKAERFFRSIDCNRYTLSRAILKLLAGKYLKKSPVEIEVVEGDNKKPIIKGCSDFHFNISHAGNNSMIVFNDEEIGVDIEELNPSFNYIEIMGGVFSEAEKEAVLNANVPVNLFYNLWTRKEALLKATAKGIDEDFRLFTCLDGQHALNGDLIGTELNWMIETFAIPNNIVCSLAFRRSIVISPQFLRINNRFLDTILHSNI